MLVVLVLVVVLVAIDAAARLDERSARAREAKQRPGDERLITTQKIIVDLSKRG